MVLSATSGAWFSATDFISASISACLTGLQPLPSRTATWNHTSAHQSYLGRPPGCFGGAATSPFGVGGAGTIHGLSVAFSSEPVGTFAEARRRRTPSGSSFTSKEVIIDAPSPL